MIKRFVFACAAAVVVIPAAGCSSPATAEPIELCDLVSAADLNHEFGEPLTITKRLAGEPESPWAYCLYGNATQHFLTLGAPIDHLAGNVHLAAGPNVDAGVAEAFEKAANTRVPDAYTIDPIDLPVECGALQKAAEAVIGTITHARGTANPSALTCDFIGRDGKIAAESRPLAFARFENLIGVEILAEPDAVVKGVKTAKELKIEGTVDHSGVAITITPDGEYTSVGLTPAERTFARRFLDASWR